MKTIHQTLSNTIPAQLGSIGEVSNVLLLKVEFLHEGLPNMVVHVILHEGDTISPARPLGRGDQVVDDLD